jgi:hypothetical protein
LHQLITAPGNGKGEIAMKPRAFGSRNTPTFVLATVVGILAATGTAKADFVFLDGTFNNSDWSQTLFTAGSGGTASATQNSPGGNPDSYFQLNNTVNAPSATVGSGVAAFYQRIGFTYDPSAQGAIDSIDYGVDLIVVSVAADAELALMQNGNVYLSNPEVVILSGGLDSHVPFRARRSRLRPVDDVQRRVWTVANPAPGLQQHSGGNRVRLRVRRQFPTRQRRLQRILRGG